MAVVAPLIFIGRYPGNTAGAKFGTGYCDAQCPHDVKFINGEANLLDWTGTDSSSRPMNRPARFCALTSTRPPAVDSSRSTTTYQGGGQGDGGNRRCGARGMGGVRGWRRGVPDGLDLTIEANIEVLVLVESLQVGGHLPSASHWSGV